jgi:hypothetical protein
LALSRVGKRVQFDEETWQAIDAVMPRNGLTFQELTDEALKDVLKKYKQPVGFMTSSRGSVQKPPRRKRSKRGK